MKNTDRIVSKIKKLLSLSNDQQGTPEGDISLSRAMQMMAEYGVSTEEVAEEDIDKNVDYTVVDLSGVKYLPQHRILLHYIADSLNCKSIFMSAPNDFAEIFGRGIDRERVLMLYSAAAPMMIASAMKAVPSGAPQIRMRRLSHMHGYATAVMHSLTDHETKVRTDHGDSKAVILADKDNARKAMEKKHPSTRTLNSNSRMSRSDYDAGFNSGKKFDTGKNNRINGRRALSA